MEHLQEQLAKIEQDLSAEKQKGPEGDQTIIARLESEQAHILEQIMLANQAKEQQEREVHTQEVNESNSDIAVAVFDALIPEPKVFESVLGLMEFSDWRSGFYQLFDAALADRTKLMDEKHVEELAQKDEKIRMLGKQGLEIQRQLDEANQKMGEMDSLLTEQHEELVEIQNDFVELKMDVVNVRNERDIAFNSLREVREQASELKSQLEAAQKPREEAKPSQAFNDRMSEIKSKNEARIKSAAELALENSAPFRGKVEISLPEIKQQERPFQGESGNDTSSNNSNDQLPSAQVDATVNQEATFPVPDNDVSVHAPDLSTGNVRGQQVYSEVAEGQGTDGEAPVTASQLEQRLAKFAQEHGLVGAA